MQEERGFVPAFTLATFYETLWKLDEEKIERHERRKAKRKRLNLAVSPSVPPEGRKVHDSDSSKEAAGAEEHTEVGPGLKRERMPTKAARLAPQQSNKAYEVHAIGGKAQRLRNSSSKLEGPLTARSKEKQRNTAKIIS